MLLLRDFFLKNGGVAEDYEAPEAGNSPRPGDPVGRIT